MLYAIFVNALVAAKASTIIYLWTVKWVVDSEEAKYKDTDLTSEESWDLYQYFNVCNFIAAFILIPLFGYMADKLDLGNQIMATFGLRGVALMGFFVMDSPHGSIVIFTFIMITLMSSLQGVSVDALFAKRLPGDCRATLQSVKILIQNLGHLCFVSISLSLVDYFNDIHRTMVFASIFDASVLFMTMFAILISGFDTDLHVGSMARNKGSKVD